MQKQLEYTFPFKLDETKLTAIVDTAHEYLGDAQYTLLPDRFEVIFSEVDREELSSLDTVLALDNSSSRKVQRVVMTSASVPQASNTLGREIEIDLGQKKRNSSGSRSTIIAINIQGDDATWARHALSAVEQQIERTSQRYTVGLVWLILFVAAFGTLFFSLEPSMRPPPTVDSYTMWLTSSDLGRVQQMLAKDDVLSEQDFKEVLTMQLRNVAGEQTEQQISPKAKLKFYLISGGCLFVLGCAVLLLAVCYPHAVFYWGDGKDRYESLLTMRNVIWNIIRSVTIVAVIGSIFASTFGAAFFSGN
jgi:hypothetical protein